MQQTIRTFVDSESDKLTIDLPQAFRHRHLEVLVIADDSSDILAEQKDTVRALRNSMGVLKGHIGDGVEYQNKCRSE
ncbi:MAG: hypothetical protein EOM20_21405, partial [Spartobacteria bacterium]|nr:hypothetical protein [Spartobacteria bacterium]